MILLDLLPMFAIALGLIFVIGTAGLWRGLRRPPRFTYATALARGLATEPSELGLTAEPLSLRDARGRTTVGWEITGQRPDGPTVVMIHGYGSGRYNLLQHAPLHAGFASRLILFDLPGQGQSAARCGTAGINEWRDVLAVLEQTCKPDEPVVLYGRSMGAGIALAVAKHEPWRCRGLILEGVYRSWAAPIRRRLWMRRYPPEPFTTLVGLIARLAWPQLKDFDRVRLAEDVECPALLLHGGLDPICPPQDAQQVADALKHAELVVLEEGLHSGLRQTDEATYDAAVARFYTRLEQARHDAPTADAPA